MFNAAREADYDALAKEIRTLVEALGADTTAARESSGPGCPD